MTNKTLISKIKKILTIVIILAVVIAAAGFAVYLYLSKPKDPKPIIEEMAKKYYETVIYDKYTKAYKDDEFDKKMKSLEVTGIEQTLFDINRYIDHKDKHLLLNPEDSGVKCDFYKTKATYYPKSPYSATDYELKLTLECENQK